MSTTSRVVIGLLLRKKAFPSQPSIDFGRTNIEHVEEVFEEKLDKVLQKVRKFLLAIYDAMDTVV